MVTWTYRMKLAKSVAPENVMSVKTWFSFIVWSKQNICYENMVSSDEKHLAGGELARHHSQFYQLQFQTLLQVLH